MKKSKTPLPQHTDRSFFAELDRWLKDFFEGEAPAHNKDFCFTGQVNQSLKLNTTKNINLIISDPRNKGKHFKFGKTGHAPTRSDKEDYRGASYRSMYLLYESKSAANVENLEMYYSKKYKGDDRCDNIDTNSLGKMKSLDGLYYLYLVI